MATYRKRNNKWHVQVRRAGYPQSKSFISKTDAHKWVRHVEGDMDKAILPIDTRILEGQKYEFRHDQSVPVWPLIGGHP